MEQVIPIRLNIAKPPFQLHARGCWRTRALPQAHHAPEAHRLAVIVGALHRRLVGRRWRPLLALVLRLTEVPNWNAGLAMLAVGSKGCQRSCRGVRRDQGLEHFGKPFGGTIRPEALNADAGAFTQ